MDLEHLLNEHGVKPTANRLLIARALHDGGCPLSQQELETALETVDKSVISRTLSLMRSHRLVHAIESGETTRYELCLSHGGAHDDDTHVHFYCERCHRTVCLDDISIPEVVLPEGYRMTTANYLLKGICPRCGCPVND